MADLLAADGAKTVNERLQSFWQPFEDHDTALREAGSSPDSRPWDSTVDQALGGLDLGVPRDALVQAMQDFTSSGYVDFGDNELALGGIRERGLFPRTLLPRDRRHADELALALRHPASFGATTSGPPLVRNFQIANQGLSQYLQRPLRRATQQEANSLLQSMQTAVARQSLMDAVGRFVATPQIERGTDGTISVSQPAAPAPADAELGKLQQELTGNDAKKMLDCWAKAGYHTYFWGWSVCLDRQCADLLQDMLLKLSGGKASAMLLAATRGLIQAGTLTAAAKAAAAAAGSALLGVLVGLSFYIAGSIHLNKTDRGVCISGNWTIPVPVIGGVLGQFVWCKGR